MTSAPPAQRGVLEPTGVIIVQSGLDILRNGNASTSRDALRWDAAWFCLRCCFNARVYAARQTDGAKTDRRLHALARPRHHHVCNSLYRIVILQYQARLRLPDSLSHSQKMQCVDHIIEVLDLTSCQDTSEYDTARAVKPKDRCQAATFLDSRPRDSESQSRSFYWYRNSLDFSESKS